MRKLNKNSNKEIYTNCLIKISKVMNRSHPVFIIGAARSGTSTLYRTLQKHSVFQPKKIDLTEVQIFNYTNRSYLLENEEGSAPLSYMLHNRETYKHFLTTIKEIQLMHRAVHMIFGYKSIDLKLADRVQLWWYLNFNHLVLRSFYYFAGKARESNRLVEKSPNNLRHAIKLKLAFPNSKLLYIYRHPIDVYTSYVKRSMIEPNASWLKLTADKFCEMYRNNTRLTLNYSQKMKDHILLIRYEDFTQKTDTEFKKICRFLEVPFEKEAILERNPDLTIWEPDPYLFAKITHKTKKWQDYISFKSAKYIETQLTEEMKVLNFERYTNHK